MNSGNNEVDPLLLVMIRNEFYKGKFYFAFGIYLLSLIVVGVLITILVYLVRNPSHPLYFVTDSVSRLLQDVPKTEPHLSTAEVEKWTIRAVESALSYDFVNYRSQLQNAQKFFTEYGWQEYMKGLTASNNLLALSQRKLVIVARVVEKPTLEREGILGGAYAWRFNLPVLITYMLPPFDEKSRFQNPVMMSVIVQRQSLLSSYNGLGIVQMIGNIVYTPPAQNIMAPPS